MCLPARADNQGMQLILLGLACVLLAIWGAGSVAHALTHAAGAWLASVPYAAAALIFTGMFFGPARSYAGAEEEADE